MTAAVVALGLALAGSVVAIILMARKLIDIADELRDALLAKSLLGEALTETNRLKLDAERKRDEADARAAVSAVRELHATDRLAAVEKQRNAALASEVESARAETVASDDPVAVLNRELRTPILP